MSTPLLQDIRPQEVELLFDAERPKVSEDPRPSWVHIGQIQKGGCDVSPGHFAPINSASNKQENESCREDSECPTYIEMSQVNAGSACELAEQQVANQIAGENKENVHSEIAVCLKSGRRDVLPFHEVTEHHQGDGNSP